MLNVDLFAADRGKIFNEPDFLNQFIFKDAWCFHFCGMKSLCTHAHKHRRAFGDYIQQIKPVSMQVGAQYQSA